MTETNAQLVGFHFDDRKSFAQNREAFLEATKADDPEMAAILGDNWDLLVAVVREGERDSKARNEFNVKVSSALDALVVEPGKSKDGT